MPDSLRVIDETESKDMGRKAKVTWRSAKPYRGPWPLNEVNPERMD